MSARRPGESESRQDGAAALRVLVVADSPVARRLVTKGLAHDPEIEVVGAAASRKQALALLDRLDPDAVALDLQLPIDQGLVTVSELCRAHWRTPLVVWSAAGQPDAALEALRRGATDFVAKPAGVSRIQEMLDAISGQLLPRLKAACGRQVLPAPARTGEAREGPARVVVIAASTGGPQALAHVIPALPSALAAPVLIAQHMPENFTAALARSLDRKATLTVREAFAGARARPGEVWVARGAHDLELVAGDAGGTEPLELALQPCMQPGPAAPSADRLFRSAAATQAGRVLAVVLSGMGRDGLEGARAVHEAGGRIVAQDEATSVVWGMPGAVAEAGLADEVVPLSGLAATIERHVGTTGSRRRAI